MKEPQKSRAKDDPARLTAPPQSADNDIFADARRRIQESGGEVKVTGKGFIPGRKKAIATSHDVLLGSPREVLKLESSPGKYTPRGRKLRKAFERPRPDLPSDAPENRSRKIVSMTLPPELLEDVDRRARELDVDRTAYIEAALRASLKPTP